MKRKPIVGETLYSLNIGNAVRLREQVLTPVKVLSVGRKYFKCAADGWEHSPTEYRLENWVQRTEYSADSQLFESERAWIDEKEASDLHKRIVAAFSLYPRRELIPLEKLRAINSILEAK